MAQGSSILYIVFIRFARYTLLVNPLRTRTHTFYIYKCALNRCDSRCKKEKLKPIHWGRREGSKLNEKIEYCDINADSFDLILKMRSYKTKYKTDVAKYSVVGKKGWSMKSAGIRSEWSKKIVNGSDLFTTNTDVCFLFPNTLLYKMFPKKRIT